MMKVGIYLNENDDTIMNLKKNSWIDGAKLFNIEVMKTTILIFPGWNISHFNPT